MELDMTFIDRINFKQSFLALACMLLIATTFTLNIYRSIELATDINPSTWSVNAIPYALSRVVFHHDKYTSNKIVSETFMHGRNTASNNAGIDAVLKLDKEKLGPELTLWDNEDKGIIDFVSLSFQILGFKAERIIYFYYLLLFLSAMLYVIENIASPSRLIILLQFLVMLYLVQPMVALNPQLTSLAAPRAFPVLAIIASLHCIFFALTPKKTLLSIVSLITQVCIIIFVTHLRIVTYWEILAVGSFCIGMGIIRLFSKEALLSFLPLFLLLLGLVSLQIYRQEMFPQSYQNSGQPLTRVMWHNILSGFAFDPTLAKHYQIKIDDISVIDMVGRYLSENNRYSEWESLGALEGGGRESGYPSMRWAPYEKIAKEIVFNTCTLFPLNCLKANLYYKPLSLIKNLSWAYGLRPLPADLDVYVSTTFKQTSDVVKVQFIELTHKLDEKNQRAYLWSPIALVLIAFTFIFCSTDLSIFFGLFTFALFSFVPSIVGYPGLHTIVDTIIAVGMLAYMTLNIILHKAFDFFLSKRQTNPINKAALSYG